MAHILSELCSVSEPPDGYSRNIGTDNRPVLALNFISRLCEIYWLALLKTPRILSFHESFCGRGEIVFIIREIHFECLFGILLVTCEYFLPQIVFFLLSIIDWKWFNLIAALTMFLWWSLRFSLFFLMKTALTPLWIVINDNKS